MPLNSSVNLLRSSFVGNISNAGKGGNGGTGIGIGGGGAGSGGTGYGGAVLYVNALDAVACSFSGNQATTGGGGNAGSVMGPVSGGSGGIAAGGAIFSNTGAATIRNSTFSANVTQGGQRRQRKH